ncbi:hypothetical protein ABW636_12275 [Aquimarina sp. 2201CG1-2-11]|uniref:hypothetical protein n=1 Tax=Aquimarina discodermiae TaxID=3231043 RepID=UPI003461895E
MGKNLYRLLILFIVVVISSYLIQIGIINAFFLDRDIPLIQLSYIFNSLFAILFIIAMTLLSKKYNDQLGFVFMAGSLIKIGIFMAICKIGDIEVNKNTFVDFFIAYVICLIFEVICISKILNNHK